MPVSWRVSLLFVSMGLPKSADNLVLNHNIDADSHLTSLLQRRVSLPWVSSPSSDSLILSWKALKRLYTWAYYKNVVCMFQPDWSVSKLATGLSCKDSSVWSERVIKFKFLSRKHSWVMTSRLSFQDRSWKLEKTQQI